MVGPETHPYLSSIVSGMVAGVAGFLHEVPAWAPSWSLSLKRSAPMSTATPTLSNFNPAIQKVYNDAEELVKFLLRYVPGADAAEKAKAITDRIEPWVNGQLTKINLDELELRIVDGLLGLVVSTVVAAELS